MSNVIYLEAEPDSKTTHADVHANKVDGTSAGLHSNHGFGPDHAGGIGRNSGKCKADVSDPPVDGSHEPPGC